MPRTIKQRMRNVKKKVQIKFIRARRTVQSLASFKTEKLERHMRPTLNKMRDLRVRMELAMLQGLDEHSPKMKPLIEQWDAMQENSALELGSLAAERTANGINLGPAQRKRLIEIFHQIGLIDQNPHLTEKSRKEYITSMYRKLSKEFGYLRASLIIRLFERNFVAYGKWYVNQRNRIEEIADLAAVIARGNIGN